MRSKRARSKPFRERGGRASAAPASQRRKLAVQAQGRPGSPRLLRAVVSDRRESSFLLTDLCWRPGDADCAGARRVAVRVEPVPLPPAGSREWRLAAVSIAPGVPGSRPYTGSSSGTSRSCFGSGPSASPGATERCRRSWSACCGAFSHAACPSTASRGCGAGSVGAACWSPSPAGAGASVPRVRRRSSSCGPSG
jgi:hypothetical protein